MTWTKAPKANPLGLRQSIVYRGFEFGVFENTVLGRKWCVRLRPVDTDGKPVTNTWGNAHPFDSKTKAVQYVERQAIGQKTSQF